MRILLRVLKTTTLALLVLGFLGLSADVLKLTPAQRVALPYKYSLIEWEACNLLSKWVHRLVTSLPWRDQPALDRQSQVLQYFQLGEEVNALSAELTKTAAQRAETAPARMESLEAEMTELKATRKSLRNDVEETLEATVSAVLTQEEISSWRGLIFPPVDIRLSSPPKLLVTSPRDQIQRYHEVLLEPDVKVDQMEAMENTLKAEWDLAAVVVDLGGLSTYPASIVDTAPLSWTLHTAAHEWLHQYLAFFPLGNNIHKSPEMLTLNETMANIIGDEVGDRAYKMLGGTLSPPASGGSGDEAETAQEDENRFDYAREMRETRLHVDDLLARGAIEEAEAYMEERRLLFLENGFYIRKLNQAYFAFYGTYADRAESVSPIAEQLQEYRSLMPVLKAFVTTMSKMSSYPEFLDALERLRVESTRQYSSHHSLLFQLCACCVSGKV